jgi:hypothetical protein
MPAEWLTKAFVELVVSVAASLPAGGPDDTVAAVSGLFLDGAREPNSGAAASASRAAKRSRRKS